MMLAAACIGASLRSAHMSGLSSIPCHLWLTTLIGLSAVGPRY